MGSPWATAMNQKVGQRAPFERSKNVVQVAANRDKLRNVGEQKGEKRFAGFATSCHCLAGCVGSGKI